MANEKNLIPFTSEQSREEAKKNGGKGGRASGKARRRKKSMKQVMEMLLNMPANTSADWNMLVEMGIDTSELSEEDVTNLLIVNATLLKQAKEGDVASVKELRSIIQDDLYQKEKLKIEKEKLKLEKQKLEPVIPEEKPYTGIPANMVAPSFSSVLFDIEERKHSEYVFPGGRGSTKSSFVGLQVVDLIKKTRIYTPVY